MTQEQLKQAIESTRDCDPASLNAAVSRGLHRGKSERLDYKKLACVAAMCAVTAVFCVALSTADLVPNSGQMTLADLEILSNYLTSVGKTICSSLGGY